MPWGAKDAKRHTKKAKSAKSKRQWGHVANSVLERTGDEGRAVAAANSVIKKRGMKKRSKKRSKGRKSGRR